MELLALEPVALAVIRGEAEDAELAVRVHLELGEGGRSRSEILRHVGAGESRPEARHRLDMAQRAERAPKLSQEGTRGQHAAGRITVPTPVS